MTYEQREQKKLDRFLSSLCSESEFFGLVGTGYPNSFYKIYVRASATSKWWRFGRSAGPVTVDPIRAQARLPVKARVTTVWAPLAHLVHYDFHPDKPAVVRLMAWTKAFDALTVHLHDSPAAASLPAAH